MSKFKENCHVLKKKKFSFLFLESFFYCLSCVVAVMTMMELLKMKLKSDSVRLWSLWRTT